MTPPPPIKHALAYPTLLSQAVQALACSKSTLSQVQHTPHTVHTQDNYSTRVALFSDTSFFAFMAVTCTRPTAAVASTLTQLTSTPDMKGRAAQQAQHFKYGSLINQLNIPQVTEPFGRQHRRDTHALRK